MDHQLKVFILSGPVQSGKTTALKSWVEQQESSGVKMGGFLAPDVAGSRFLFSVRQKEWQAFQILNPAPDEDLITVGRFKFLGAAFDWMHIVINNDLVSECDWIIVDEVGKLEVRGEGAYNSVIELLRKLQSNDKTKALLVVRDYLVSEVLEKFVIAEPRVIKITDLENLA